MPSTATAGLSAQELLDRRRAQNKLAQRRFREKARLARKTDEAVATAAATAAVTIDNIQVQQMQPPFSLNQEHALSAPSPNTAAFFANLEQSLLFPQASAHDAVPTNLPSSQPTDVSLMLQDWGSLVSERVMMDQLSSSSSASSSLPTASSSFTTSSSLAPSYLTSFPTDADVSGIFSPSELNIIASGDYTPTGSSSSDSMTQSSSP